VHAAHLAYADVPADPMNAALRSRLVELAHQLELEPSASQVDALLDYLELLDRWNSIYNLTAVREPADMLVHHLVDCLAVVRPLERELGASPNRRVLDVGSGAGLPGIVVALMSPQTSVVCVDKVGKKVAFIRQVIATLGLKNLGAEHVRVERFESRPFDLIVSRAFSSLADFTRLTLNHLAPGGRWLAMKGKPPIEEIAKLAAELDVFHVEPLLVPGLNAQRCLVWIRLRQSL
jgi:16S rRNA (guanine527-N7)-methyltransferase